jgi:NAD-dependent deacetylase
MKLEKNLVVLTGAGMSAESGIKTFRDNGGLWEEYNIMEVATPEAFNRNPELVLRFYNQRRKELLKAQPNEGHRLLAELEKHFNVHIITQNVDDLHERAGSSKVLHLHGELRKVRSTGDERLIYNWDNDLKIGDKCEKGYQLRPHIVWFGEAVPAIEEAAAIARKADIFVVIGTSLQVYPAAGLIHYTDFYIPKYLIDPNIPESGFLSGVQIIQKGASEGVRILMDALRTLS